VAALTPRRWEALAPPAQQRLALLAPILGPFELYLAGSAALALYLGHRTARALDYMTATDPLTGPSRRDLLGRLLDLEAATEVETARDGYLFARLGETAVRFFYYPYPLIDPLESAGGGPVASAVDLGLMKLGAIISRGHCQDLIDLLYLCQEIPLETLLTRSAEKFGHVRDFPLQALKGLADRSLAREEPLPDLLAPLTWTEADLFWEREVRRLGRARVGLTD
jgi:hypothetical protein